MFSAVSALQVRPAAVSDLPGRAEGSRLPAVLPRVLSQVHQDVAGPRADALSVLQGGHGRR